VVSDTHASRSHGPMNPVALVTGGSRGIGLATARLFASSGWDVVSVSRSPSASASDVHLHAPIDLLQPGVPQASPLSLARALASLCAAENQHRCGRLGARAQRVDGIGNWATAEAILPRSQCSVDGQGQRFDGVARGFAQLPRAEHRCASRDEPADLPTDAPRVLNTVCASLCSRSCSNLDWLIYRLALQICGVNFVGEGRCQHSIIRDRQACHGGIDAGDMPGPRCFSRASPHCASLPRVHRCAYTFI
jgi:hypothetical protein